MDDMPTISQSEIQWQLVIATEYSVAFTGIEQGLFCLRAT